MGKRIGLIAVILIVASFLMTHSAWACKLLASRTCRCSVVCCPETCCSTLLTCCETAGQAAPAIQSPVAAPVAPAAPAGARQATPQQPAAPSAEPKPLEIPGLSPDVDEAPAKPAAKTEKKSAGDSQGNAEPGDLRTWRDITGQYAIRARFVNMLGNTVHLQNAEGRLLRVSLDKLSTVDQRLIREVSSLARN